MSVQFQEIGRVNAKLTGRDNVISEFTSAQVISKLEDLTTALKDIRQKLNIALTDLVNNDNNTNDDEIEDVGSLEEEDCEEEALLDVVLRKRKKSALKRRNEMLN